MRPDLKELISKEDAWQKVTDCWAFQPGTEEVSVYEAVGRVLAGDIYAKYDVPVERASTMDGIAVRSADFKDGPPDTSGWRLGQEFVRADTGDDFEDGYDSVIAIENVELLPEGGVKIIPNAHVSPGFNVKPRGCDIKKGALALKKGTLLTVLDVTAAAMCGHEFLEVRTRPRVGFIPTGSELIPIGQPLHRGQHYDTNSLMVGELLKEMGAFPVMHGIIADEEKTIEQVVDFMLPRVDILILNAGTSKGGEDYCHKILKKRGEILFSGVAAVPGRPMTVALIDKKPVINMSGPSYAAYYSCDWLVRPMVCRWLGIPLPRRKKVEAVLTKRLTMPPFFSLMARLQVERLADGTYQAEPLELRGPRAAGDVAAMTANGVYITTPGEQPHEKGEVLTIELTREV